MDKLKIAMTVLKKHQFWALCVIMLLTTVVCWWLATGGLAGQYQARVSSINGDFGGVKVEPNHPNQAVIDKINKEQHVALKQKVLAAWEILYNQQKEATPFPTKILGEGFKKEFESLKLPQGQIDSEFRERYLDIKNYLPELQSMIDARRSVDAGTSNGDSASKRADSLESSRQKDSVDKDAAGIVTWDPASYDKLAAHFAWNGEPSTLEVVLAQEDLWVYEALLRVIRNVNRGATTQANAAVKRIDALEIGKDSRDAWNKSLEGVFRASGGGPGAMSTSASTSATSGGGSGAGPERELFVDRYVDDKGQSLPVGPDYPYVNPVPPEYKMMPVHMSLLIDERSLPRLLVACANSNMPIEVKRIRLLKMTFEPVDLDAAPIRSAGTPGGGVAPHQGASHSSSGAAPMSMPMPGAAGLPMPGAAGTRGLSITPGAASMSMSAQAPTGSSAGPAGTRPEHESIGEYDIPVDICAVIYLYNPPDREKLNVGTASAAGPVDSASSKPTAPADNPAAPAPPGR